MAEIGRQLTTVQQKANTVKSTLMAPAVLEQIKMALPAIGVNPERIARIAFTSVVLNPKLLDCTQESLVRAVILSAQLGLLPDGRQAHLIPYWNSKLKALECQFQADYKGLVTLMLRSPNVAGYTLDTIYERDEYEIISGTERRIRHKPYLKGDRGNPVLFYSIIEYKSGYQDFDYMTVAEVEEVRDKFSQKSHQTNEFSKAWVESFVEMGKKTVAKRHSKRCDISMEMALAVRASDAAEIGDGQSGIAAHAAATLGRGDNLMDLLKGQNGSYSVDISGFDDAVKDFNPSHVEEFIGLIAADNNISAEDATAEALEDIDGFKDALASWIAKNKAKPAEKTVKRTRKPRDKKDDASASTQGQNHEDPAPDPAQDRFTMSVPEGVDPDDKIPVDYMNEISAVLNKRMIFSKFWSFISGLGIDNMNDIRWKHVPEIVTWINS